MPGCSIRDERGLGRVEAAVPPDAGATSSERNERSSTRQPCASKPFLSEARMPRAQRTVMVAYFLLFLGGGVWMPYFPLYLSHLGFSGWEIGVIFGMQPALRWISALAWAYAADRWRLRHRLLVGAALSGALFFIPLLFVRSFTAMALVTGMIAVLHAPLIPMTDATVVDHLTGLGGDYGRLRLWGSVAFVLGAVLSAPLVHTFSPSVVPALLIVPTFPMVLALARLPREQFGHGERFRAPWALLTPPLTAFLATAFLIQFSCGAWAGFFAVHTAALGFSDVIPGLTWGLAVSAEVGLLYSARRILQWIAPAQLVVLALVVTAVRWALTAVLRVEFLVVGLQLGHAFTFTAFHIAAQLLLSRLVPPQSSTGGQALYGLVAFGIGGSTGLGVAGLLVDRVGTAGLFGCEAVVALLALLPALRLRRLVPN
jgi:MFS transporter, PPP family, 3-phenylpropionic acid transporter